MSKNADKVDTAIDKAGDIVDQKTQGKYTQHVDKVQDAAKKAVDKSNPQTPRRMAKLSVSVDVPLPPEKAWECASDLSRYKEWLTIHRVWRSKLPETLEKGTVSRVHRRGQGHAQPDQVDHRPLQAAARR